MKKILLIGDSISLYYSRFLAAGLAGLAEVHTKAGWTIFVSGKQRVALIMICLCSTADSTILSDSPLNTNFR